MTDTLPRHKVTENFAWHEFSCRDGTAVPAEYRPHVRRLCAALEVLRADLGRPIVIVSGYRTESHNRSIRGAKQSQHLRARAADIQVPGVSPDAVADAIERLILEGRLPSGGIGRYDTFTHYDVRGYLSRWDERTAKAVQA